eukprot:1190844-Prorocentrum_minimum.AAC.3
MQPTPSPATCEAGAALKSGSTSPFFGLNCFLPRDRGDSPVRFKGFKGFALMMVRSHVPGLEQECESHRVWERQNPDVIRKVREAERQMVAEHGGLFQIMSFTSTAEDNEDQPEQCPGGFWSALQRL